MDLNQVLVFTRVVQAGSFTAAARALGLPKSTVSRKVAELEERVGARLLQRTTRKLSLTDAGRIYYQHGARIVSEAEAADQAVGRLHSAPRGRLRVTAPVSVATLGPVVAEYLRRYPDVTVELVCTDRTVDLIEEGFDVAIRAGRLADSTLVARSLGAVRRLPVAAPGYLRKHGTPRAPRDLERHRAIVFAAGPDPTAWTLVAGEEQVEVRVAARLAVNDLSMLLDAARAALGIAFMPEQDAAADLAAGRLRRVLPAWCSPEVPLHAVYPSARLLSPNVASFIEVVRASFRLTIPPRP
jgi:DNA-binding transcriptional LysR family regulator